MPVDIFVGGQAGDEGKGKISAYASLKNNYDAVIRISSPQAGHTIEYNGKRVGLATLPCGFVNEKSKIILGRGALISVSKLEKELQETGLTNSNRVLVDEYATIVTQKHLDEELANKHLMGKIGSVGTGTGPARRDKLMKNPELVFAKDIPELKPYLTDTVKYIHNLLDKGKTLSLEGDQGFKLSLNHGEYPYVTSRDTTAPTFLGEIGVGPKQAGKIFIVFKPYVTRVDGRPMKDEVTDKKILDWCKNIGHEVGTVSGRIRKIGGFDWENAKRAIMANSATDICFTHMDIFKDNEELNFQGGKETFLEKAEKELGTKISLLSNGPKINDVIEYSK